MDVMLQIFQGLVTPQQKQLAAMAEKMGGKAALENEQTMEELASAESALTGNAGSPGEGQIFDFVELRKEIESDPEEAFKRNAEYFDHKFDIQRRQIEEAIAHTVKREGDRIISAVTAGSHDRIIDPVWLGASNHRATKSYPLLRISTTFGRRW
jgi:hypothetical protein